MWRGEVEPQGGVSALLEPSMSVLGSGRDLKVLLETKSSLVLPWWLRMRDFARLTEFPLRGLLSVRAAFWDLLGRGWGSGEAFLRAKGSFLTQDDEEAA